MSKEQSDQSTTCTGNCEGEHPGVVFEFVPGVKAVLCEIDQGQAMADIIAELKSYGFSADMDADDRYDTLKNIG